MLLKDQAVKDIALERPGATAVFRRHRIDFCCNGGRSLEEAVAKRGLALAALEADLEALAIGPVGDLPQDIPGLIDLVLTRFHAVHRQELPELIRLARRVEAVHRASPDCPKGLAVFLEETASELEDHMMKEEAILFPMLRAGHGLMATMPISRMRAEHLDHGERLETLARLTGDFTPPQGACTTWRALFAGCAKLDGDLREHIHIENNMLFARFDGDRVAGACGCNGGH